jgi:hypothetical protein
LTPYFSWCVQYKTGLKKQVEVKRRVIHNFASKF